MALAYRRSVRIKRRQAEGSTSCAYLTSLHRPPRQRGPGLETLEHLACSSRSIPAGPEKVKESQFRFVVDMME